MQIIITIKDAVIRAQNGDHDAMIALLKKYQPLISKGIGKALAFGLGTEDLENIFILTMISMLNDIDTEKLK